MEKEEIYLLSHREAIKYLHSSHHLWSVPSNGMDFDHKLAPLDLPSPSNTVSAAVGEMSHPTGVKQRQAAQQAKGGTIGEKEPTSAAALSTNQRGQHLSEKGVNVFGIVVGQQ